MRIRTRFLWMIAAGLTAGCSSGPPTMTAAQRQDAILADPAGYKPDMGQNISGGDLGSFDKSGFNKDLNDALNP